MMVSKKAKLPAVWLVHKNLTGSVKYHVATPKKLYNVAKYSSAVEKVKRIAKKHKLKAYEFENANGKWGVRKIK